MPKVTIIGAGIAGLTAALRLAERGYDVTIFERDNNVIGGKFRATEWPSATVTKPPFHEHSYHMFLNWYHNFQAIARDIGAANNFEPMDNVKFLHAGHFPHMRELVNFGSLRSVPQNLFSGVLPFPDMLLYMYSVLDLLSRPMEHNRSDDISVNGFAATRLYATDTSVGMYDEYLAKTFAVASYLTSVKSFQTFVAYGAFRPEPLYWALKGDSYNKFLSLLQAKLVERGVTFRFSREARAMTLGQDGYITNVTFWVVHPNFNPSHSEMSWAEANRLPAFGQTDAPTTEDYAIDGPLILAVPPRSLQHLLSPDILNLNPPLGEAAKLESVPMASVHLHLKEKFANRLKAMGTKLPPEPVILVNSNYKLSFVADSSLWSGMSETYLNIVSSDSRPLNHLLAPPRFTADRTSRPGGPGLSIDQPVTTLDHVLNEFRRYVPFENDEIDADLLQIDRNLGRELFINEVGSWQWRPETRTKVKNLFLAGDFCKNFIDVVCLEGAAVSGLLAAECVRQQSGVGTPIEIMRPRQHPHAYYWPAKIAFAPYAAWAKLWSLCNTTMGPHATWEKMWALCGTAIEPHRTWEKLWQLCDPATEAHRTELHRTWEKLWSLCDPATHPHAAWLKLWSLWLPRWCEAPTDHGVRAPSRTGFVQSP